MTHHAPKPPTPEDLKKFLTWDINIIEGRVFNCGREICSANSASEYFFVRVWRKEGYGKNFKRAHIIWWKATGKWPKTPIDHINRIKSDDRISNLREVSLRENAANRGRALPTGVHYRKSLRNKLKPYQAHIFVEGKQIYLGMFATAEEAINIRLRANEFIKQQHTNLTIPANLRMLLHGDG